MNKAYILSSWCNSLIEFLCHCFLLQKSQKGDPMTLLRKQLEEKEQALQEGLYLNIAFIVCGLSFG